METITAIASTYSNEATFNKAFDNSIGHSSYGLFDDGNNKLPSLLNGIQSSIVTFLHDPCNNRKEFTFHFISFSFHFVSFHFICFRFVCFPLFSSVLIYFRFVSCHFHSIHFPSLSLP